MVSQDEGFATFQGNVLLDGLDGTVHHPVAEDHVNWNSEEKKTSKINFLINTNQKPTGSQQNQATVHGVEQQHGHLLRIVQVVIPSVQLYKLDHEKARNDHKENDHRLFNEAVHLVDAYQLEAFLGGKNRKLKFKGTLRLWSQPSAHTLRIPMIINVGNSVNRKVANTRNEVTVGEK